MTEREHAAAEPSVSRVRGAYQGVALRVLMWSVALLAVLALALPDDVAGAAGVAAVGVVVAAPITRVLWLCLRWTQEQDWRFVALGLALVVVIAAGAALG